MGLKAYTLTSPSGRPRGLALVFARLIASALDITETRITGQVGCLGGSVYSHFSFSTNCEEPLYMPHLASPSRSTHKECPGPPVFPSSQVLSLCLLI